MKNLIYMNYLPHIDTKKKFYIAGFDLDWTIIKTKSGNIFPKDKLDWDLLNSQVLIKFKELAKDPECLILIITNQKGLGTQNKKLLSINHFKDKIDSIHKILGVNFILIASLQDDIYRKPRIGSIDFLIEKEAINININKSFYVGDMAGRSCDKTDTDIKFAKNLNIQFYTPEQFFLEDKSQLNYKLSGYLLDNNSVNTKIDIKPEKNKMIIITGYPSSGKTHLAKKLINEYNGIIFTLFSRDLFKNNFHKRLTKSMENYDPVIVEGLYPTNQSRQELLSLAEKYHYNTIYIYVKTSYELSYHLNLYRSIFENKSKIPEIVYMKYRKNFEFPNEEDWNEIKVYHPHISNKINKFYLF